MKYSVVVDGERFDATIELVDEGNAVTEACNAPASAAPASACAGVLSGRGDIMVVCPMPGRIRDLTVRIGQKVNLGEVLMSMEKMKFGNSIVSPVSGMVKQVLVSKDANVEAGDVLFVLVRQ